MDVKELVAIASTRLVQLQDHVQRVSSLHFFCNCDAQTNTTQPRGKGMARGGIKHLLYLAEDGLVLQGWTIVHPLGGSGCLHRADKLGLEVVQEGVGQASERHGMWGQRARQVSFAGHLVLLMRSDSSDGWSRAALLWRPRYVSRYDEFLGSLTKPDHVMRKCGASDFPIFRA